MSDNGYANTIPPAWDSIVIGTTRAVKNMTIGMVGITTILVSKPHQVTSPIIHHIYGAVTIKALNVVANVASIELMTV